MISPDRFSTGLTLDEFSNAMTVNRPLFEGNLAAVRLTAEDAAFFEKLRPLGLHVFALAADW